MGGVTIVGGTAGWLLGVAGFAAVWTVVGRAEPRDVRRDRELARQQLPHVVLLLAAVLRGGGSVVQALGQVSRALPGPATAALRLAEGRLRVGAPASEVWADLAADPRSGRWAGRWPAASRRVPRSPTRWPGCPRTSAATTGPRSRTSPVPSASGGGAPGLCLLPAFLLVGIVPAVVASLAALGW